MEREPEWKHLDDAQRRAYLRAVRMQVGLTQQDMAAKFKVPPKIAGAWENEKNAGYVEVPEDVLDYVTRVKAIRNRMIDDILADCADVAEGETVTLTFYRSQAQFELAGKTGYYAIVNGAALAAATILESEGVVVEWEYPPTRDTLMPE